MDAKCEHCGKPLTNQDDFCPHCKNPQTRLQKISQSGEVLLRAFESNSLPINNNDGPIKLIVSNFMESIKQLMFYFKNPKKLIFPITLSFIWLLSTLLPRLNINNEPLKFISYLSFAEGGISNSFQNILGGLIGKGLVAYFYSTLLNSIISKNNIVKPMFNGLRTIFSVFSNITKTLSSLLISMGVTFMISNFFMGSVNSQKSMVLIVSFILSLLASQSNSFLNQVITSFKSIDTKTFFSGLSLGFLLSIMISQTNSSLILYIIGLITIITGIIVKFVPLKNKEVQV